MQPTDGWRLWVEMSGSILAILIKTYFDEVLNQIKKLSLPVKKRIRLCVFTLSTGSGYE
jgi:hypothetical protein